MKNSYNSISVDPQLVALSLRPDPNFLHWLGLHCWIIANALRQPKSWSVGWSKDFGLKLQGKMPRKPRVMLGDLSRLWDGDPDVRSHLRKFKSVLHVDGATFRATVASCSQNVTALIPVLQLTREHLN